MPGVRRWIPLLVLGVLAVVVISSIVVPRAWENRAGTARPAGTWASYLRLDLPSAWTVTTRTLTQDSESVQVESVQVGSVEVGSGQVAPDSIEPRECRVTIWSVGVTPPGLTLSSGARTVAVRVSGRTGRLVTTERTAILRWAYARDAQAEATCDTPAAPDPTLLRAIAGDWLTIGPAPRTLPFTFDGRLPRAPVVEVDLDERATDSPTVGSTLRMEAVAPPGGWSLSLGSGAEEDPTVELTRTRTAANGLVVEVSDDGTRGCLVQAPRICAQAYWNGDALPPRGVATSTALVVGLLGGIRLAEPLDDPATWFDLDTALA